MKRKFLALIVGLLPAICLVPLNARAEAPAFAYVSQNYIVTAEQADTRSFMVNVINISDYVIVVQPYEFIYRGKSGRHYIGQVFEREHKDTLGVMQRYTASSMLRGRSFAGLKVLGIFDEQDAIEEISIRIGSRRFFMQPLEKNAFNQLARKIQSLDIDNPDSDVDLESANIQEMGRVITSDGSPEWENDWNDLLMADGVNPPRILVLTEIETTPDARKARLGGKVRLSGIVTKDGGIRSLRVLKGLGKGLDERAVDGVQNSWLFLPGTKNGEVYEAQITLEVEFPDPNGD